MRDDPGQLTVRLASRSDYQVLARFISSASLVHRHLDWRTPLEWLGTHPFLIAESDRNIEGVLACPPDPAGVAWIRLFASPHHTHRAAWDVLINHALDYLRGEAGGTAVAIALYDWFEDLLKHSRFSLKQSIVVLEWGGQHPPEPELQPGIMIRAMLSEDLPQVQVVDQLAFDRIWQNSLETLEQAYEQSALCTVAEYEDRVVGYQISTISTLNGHLARLAVLPNLQGKNIGYALVRDLLAQFKKHNAWRVTVNTQNDNLASLALYQKVGFRLTGETFPVYQYLPDPIQE